MLRKVWTVLAGAAFAASMGVAAHAGELNSQAATPSIIGSLDVASYSTLTPETMGRTVGTQADATARATAAAFGPNSARADTTTATQAIVIAGSHLATSASTSTSSAR